MKERVMTPDQAADQGMVSITTAFSKGEQWMIPNTLAHLRRANILCAAVQVAEGIEVWRTTSGMKFAKKEKEAP